MAAMGIGTRRWSWSPIATVCAEVCDLQWQQIELSEGRLHVHRVTNGLHSVHPIRGDEMRALRKLRRDYPARAARSSGGVSTDLQWAVLLRLTGPRSRAE